MLKRLSIPLDYLLTTSPPVGDIGGTSRALAWVIGLDLAYFPLAPQDKGGLGAQPPIL